MLEFKNLDTTNGVKRKLKVLDVERNQDGEITKLVVDDEIYGDTKGATKINAENMNKIINFMINKEILTPERFVEIIATRLSEMVDSSYADDFTLPHVDIATCNWLLEGDYLDVIKLNKYNADITREIADVPVKLKLEVVYKNCYTYRIVETVIKGKGLSEFDDPQEAIRELVRRVPSYLTDNYILPTVEGITWSLIDSYENEVRLEDNKLIILNNEGDDVAELLVTCNLGNKVGSALVRFVLGKKYKLSTRNIEINQSIGSPKSTGVEIYSPIGKSLYVEVSGIQGNFDTSIFGNNTSALGVEITENEWLNSSIGSSSDNFYMTVSIYDSQDKTILYGTEVVNIRYNYEKYRTDKTESYWSERNKYSGFNITSVGGAPLYVQLLNNDRSVNVTVYYNGQSTVSLVASYNYAYNNNESPTTTVTYDFSVGVYTDSGYKNCVGTINYQIHYTLTPTDPFD